MLKPITPAIVTVGGRKLAVPVQNGMPVLAAIHAQPSTSTPGRVRHGLALVPQGVAPALAGGMRRWESN